MRPQRPTLPVNPSPALLPPDEVHLWVIDLGIGPPVSEARLTATTPDERDRASRFRRPVDRDRYLAAHGALRLILGEILDCTPWAVGLSSDERGKPFLKDRRSPEEIHFNLSHSGDCAIVGVACGRQVGVDVEQLRALHDLDGVADRVCSAAERAALSALAGPERDGAFFALWTRKEALAKATGEGIQAVVRQTPDDVSDRWTLVQVTDLPGYAACVAAEGKDWRLVRRS
jgi:4'-phosphopantetheinyl transferase